MADTRAVRRRMPGLDPSGRHVGQGGRPAPAGAGVLPRQGRHGQGDGRSKSSQTSPGPPSADHAQLEERDGAADHGDQPVHGRTDGVLLFRRHFLPFDKVDKWPRRRLKAGAPEGVEARTSALLEPPGGSVSPPASSVTGGIAEGLPAHRRVLATSKGPTKHLLAQVTWPERIPRPYRGFRESWANRPVPTRMPGGVGGARASLASTRFCAGALSNRRPYGDVYNHP